MARHKRLQRKETIHAQVFLRSASGRSVRELGEAPLPADLAPYRASEAARIGVGRFLEHLGFKVYMDALGLTLSIQGSPEVFEKTFAVPANRIATVPADRTIRLHPPQEIQEFVEDIILTPKPELF